MYIEVLTQKYPKEMLFQVSKPTCSLKYCCYISKVYYV